MMKIGRNSLIFQSPSIAQLFHYLSQFSYVLILMYYIKAAKYWDWYLLSIVFAYILNTLGYKYILKKDKVIINLTPTLITTSVFIFITGYSVWTYFVAVSIAILARFIIRFGENRPIFNPSTLAIVTMTCIGEGNYATPVIALADKQIWIPVIITLGILTTLISNRIIASLAYWFGFIAFTYFLHLLGAPYIILQIGTIFGFFSLLFTFHVLTDPQTTPDNKKHLFIFGIALAFVDAILRSLNVVASALIALNIVTAGYACLENKSASNLKKTLVFMLPFAMIAIGIFFGYFPNPRLDPMKYGAYQAQTEYEKKLTPPFFYEEKSKSLGIFNYQPYSTTINTNVVKNTLFNALPAPVYAVGDIDNDGYFDLMTAGTQVAFHLYKNIRGEYFKDISKEMGITEEANYKIINATFLDFNNDGKEDIFAIVGLNSKQYRLYLNTGHSFTDITHSIGLDKLTNSGKSTSIELIDYNLDGFIDLIIANYPTVEDIPENVTASSDFIFSKSHKQNIVLKNNQGKNFEDVTNQMNLSINEFTHDIGIADLNNDGFPDLYFSNDYGRDKVFYNQKGKTFKNVTLDVLGHIFNRNGMGVDFTDIEGKGYQSIYVSNISAGRFRHGMNYFWQNIDGNHFDNKSNDYDIGRCGYSWGPKFFDPDLDGNNDLLVAAGYKNGQNNAWYQINTWGAMPNMFKSKKFIADNFPKQLEIAGNQRKCLFWKKDNKFIDVGPQSGINDLYNTRTITLLDLKNNGQPIIVTGNFYHPRLLAYQNTMPISNHWVGLNLEGTTSNRQAIGAKIIYEKDHLNYSKEVFPSNGVGTLNDRRVIIGLGKEVKIPAIEIFWPSGKKQKIQSLQLDQYNKIIEL